MILLASWTVMARLLTVLTILIGLAQLASTLPARAQAQSSEGADSKSADRGSAAAPPGYEAAIDVALAQFERGEFVAAREEFLRAHKIFPNARTLRALGKVEFELKSYVDAETHLALALASAVRPLTGAQRNETEQLRDQARRHVARYTFVTEPQGAELTLDGRATALDAQRGLRLSEGEYRLEARAEGFLTLKRALQVEGGVDGSLVLALTPSLDAPLVATMPDDNAHVEVPSKRGKWWLWGGLAVVVIAGATAGVLLALRDPAQAHASGGSTGVVIPLERMNATTR